MTEEINLINDVINSGAKTGCDEDAVNEYISESNEEIYIPIIVFLFLILITFFLRKKIKS